MWENGDVPQRDFETESSLRACSTTKEEARYKESVWTARRKWLLMQQDSDLAVGVFCVPQSEQTWQDNASRLTSQIANMEWDKLVSVMITELITSKHCLQVFQYASNSDCDIKET